MGLYYIYIGTTDPPSVIPWLLRVGSQATACTASSPVARSEHPLAAIIIAIMRVLAKQCKIRTSSTNGSRLHSRTVTPLFFVWLLLKLLLMLLYVFLVVSSLLFKFPEPRTNYHVRPLRLGDAESSVLTAPVMDMAQRNPCRLGAVPLNRCSKRLYSRSQTVGI